MEAREVPSAALPSSLSIQPDPDADGVTDFRSKGTSIYDQQGHLTETVYVDGDSSGTILGGSVWTYTY